jgi:hypothetical protein
MADADAPRDDSFGKDREPAEGSRDNVNIEQPSTGSERGGGITNRPIEEEQREQQNLPPRGEAKGDSHA